MRERAGGGAPARSHALSQAGGWLKFDSPKNFVERKERKREKEEEEDAEQRNRRGRGEITKPFNDVKCESNK